MPKTQTTVIGNLTRDPEIRYLSDGTILATVTVAENTRRRENGDGEWRDHRTTFWGVTCWRKLAAYAAGSLRKGDRVVVVGETYLDEWIGADGQPRRSLKLDPVTVAVDLSRAPVRVTRLDPVTGAVRNPAVAASEPGWSPGAEVPDMPPAEEEPTEDPYQPTVDPEDGTVGGGDTGGEELGKEPGAAPERPVTVPASGG